MDGEEEEVAAPSAEGADASAGEAAAAAGAVAAATDAAAAAAAACAASVAPRGAPSARVDVFVCVALAVRECMRRCCGGCCGGGCGDRPIDGDAAVCIAAGMDAARRCTAPFALPASAFVTLAARCHMTTLLLLKKRWEVGRSVETIISRTRPDQPPSPSTTQRRSLTRPDATRSDQRAGRGNDCREINPIDHYNIHHSRVHAGRRMAHGRLASPRIALRNDRLHPIAPPQAHTHIGTAVTIRA